MSARHPNGDAASPPAIGGLLRLAWQTHRERIYEEIRTTGFPEVTRAQFELIRWPGIDGLRPSEVAQLAGLSKQAVNDLLGELERGGYVERHSHPRDGRARVVRLTERGTELQRTAHEISRSLEDAWAARVGSERFAALRATLEDMVRIGLAPGRPG
jgi:DNA-binding MarR family transcriptional regulator